MNPGGAVQEAEAALRLSKITGNMQQGCGGLVQVSPEERKEERKKLVVEQKEVIGVQRLWQKLSRNVG